MAGIGDGRGEYMRLGFGSIPSLLFCFVSFFYFLISIFKQERELGGIDGVAKGDGDLVVARAELWEHGIC